MVLTNKILHLKYINYQGIEFKFISYNRSIKFSFFIKDNPATEGIALVFNNSVVFLNVLE